MKRFIALMGMVLMVASCRTGGGVSDGNGESGTTPAPSVQGCREAFDDDKQVSHYVEQCRYLWSEAGCRDAWTEALDNPPGNRGEYVIRKCAASYCPDLKNPKPQLCQFDLANANLLDEDPDWLELWTTFNAVVLSRDLDLSGDDEAAATVARRLLQQVAMSTEPASSDEEPNDEPAESDPAAETAASEPAE